MYTTSLVAASVLTLVTQISAQGSSEAARIRAAGAGNNWDDSESTYNAFQCPKLERDSCTSLGAYGCMQIDTEDFTSCVDYSRDCSEACEDKFSYQKFNSYDTKCICSEDDAAQTADSLPFTPYNTDYSYHAVQCPAKDLRGCLGGGTAGCVQIDGTTESDCVVQTTECDSECSNKYAYVKYNSNDHKCICTEADASQSFPTTTTYTSNNPDKFYFASQCLPKDVTICLEGGTAGCVQIDGAEDMDCVDDAPQCSAYCPGHGYVKYNSYDDTCICSLNDASEPKVFY